MLFSEHTFYFVKLTIWGGSPTYLSTNTDSNYKTPIAHYLFIRMVYFIKRRMKVRMAAKAVVSSPASAILISGLRMRMQDLALKILRPSSGYIPFTRDG